MPDPHRAHAVGILAEHTDHITAAIRANAETGLPEDAPGMERAAELLGLHKARLITAEHGGTLEPLLTTLTAATSAQGAVEAAHGVARRWAILRTHGGAAGELRAALDGPTTPLPFGFARHSAVSVSCAHCGYTHDADEDAIMLLDSVEEATKVVVDHGWTVLPDGTVLCHSDDDEHQEIRAAHRRAQELVAGEGQQTIADIEQPS
ncbi:hypothetical protein [Streptomyces sp. NPDC055109]